MYSPTMQHVGEVPVLDRQPDAWIERKNTLNIEECCLILNMPPAQTLHESGWAL